MRNLLLKVSYNGKNYHGFQVQQNAITVQEVLQKAIERVLGHKIELKGCSRTDAGVHANEYFVSFKTTNKIACNRLVLGVNAVLPKDIAAQACEEKPLEFHARYCARGKEYIYKVLNCALPNPILSDLVYWHRWELDTAQLHSLAQEFVGRHDFKRFSARGAKPMPNYVRTIYYFDVFKIDDIIYFRVCGDGFLYKMVRIMVGTLLECQKVGKGREDLAFMLKGQKGRVGRPMPPEGLYLNRVFY